MMWRDVFKWLLTIIVFAGFVSLFLYVGLKDKIEKRSGGVSIDMAMIEDSLRSVIYKEILDEDSIFIEGYLYEDMDGCVHTMLTSSHDDRRYVRMIKVKEFVGAKAYCARCIKEDKYEMLQMIKTKNQSKQ